MNKFIIQSEDERWAAYDFGLGKPYLTADPTCRSVFDTRQEAECQLPIYKRALLKLRGIQVELIVVESKIP